MTPAQLISMVYREDERASEDWSSILDTLPDARPVIPQRSSDREALEREWLVAALDRNAFYSVRHQVETQAEDGSTKLEEKKLHFSGIVHFPCQ